MTVEANEARRLGRWGDVSPTERFWGRVRKSDGCWEWTGSRDPKGYGRVNVRGRYWLAHRLAFFLDHGREPIGPLLHSCDNTSCARPTHLREGTIAENNAEMRAKGRGTRGDRTHLARLTPEAVRAIRSLHGPARGYESLAIQFGVGATTIRAVVKGWTWEWVK